MIESTVMFGNAEGRSVEKGTERKGALGMEAGSNKRTYLWKKSSSFLTGGAKDMFCRELC